MMVLVTNAELLAEYRRATAAILRIHRKGSAIPVPAHLVDRAQELWVACKSAGLI
jgi:hypothetical protein